VKPRHLVISLVALAAVLAGCGGSGSATAPPASSNSSSSGTAVKISDFKFAPATLTVKQGASVTVTNEDSTAHTATADDGTTFDTGPLNQGASQTITLHEPGTYPYHCSIHPFMKAKIVVS
jgi:plastocyanin